MNKLSWVDRVEKRRDELIQFIGGTATDFNGLLAAILPFILITSLLHNVILEPIIVNVLLRLIASIIGASVVEFYAIGVMVLEQRVQAFNALAEPGTHIRYNAKSAKVNYIILVMLTVITGHILPVLLELPENVALLSIPFMMLIAWYGYEMFSVNYTLKDRVKQLKKQEEDRQLAEATKAFAERGAAEAVATKASAEAAKETATAARLEAEAKLVRARTREKKADAAPVFTPPPAALKSNNGHTIPNWRELSYDQIDAYITAGIPRPTLTDAMLEILEIIKAHVGDKGFGTTDLVGQVMNNRGLPKSQSGILQDLRLLYAAGKIGRTGNVMHIERELQLNGHGIR